jgi:hypothetical protein
MKPKLLFIIRPGLTSAHTSTVLSTSGICAFKQKKPLMVSLSNHGAVKFSFSKLILLTTAMLLLFGWHAQAQQMVDTGQTRPMTRYEKAIAKITDPNDLKTAYDTMKTDYDRRYFLNALPGYFADHKITAVPDWVEKAVLEGIKSKDPQYIREATWTAGALKINYSGDLMELYPTIRTTYGSHEDMLKSTILVSISRMENAGKKQFYYDILTKDEMPLGCATFSALLDAIYAEPDLKYAQKLTEHSSTLGTQIAQISADKDQEKKYWLPRLQEIKDKIDKVQTRIATGGGK